MRAIDPTKPWGYWLRLEPGRRGDVLVDDYGREWSSIREAFWCGRLGMPLRDGNVPDEQMEMLHAVLASKLRDPHTNGGDMRDLLTGQLRIDHFYHSWLVSSRLTAMNGSVCLDCRITDEGVSVVRMLEATQPTPVRQQRASRATVDQLTEVVRGPLGGEERRERVERMADDWDAAFVRRSIAGQRAVLLQLRGEGPIPLMTTVWTARFVDRQDRDAFFDWLCDRLDRWPAWATIAGRYGGPELSQHLLQVLAASMADERLSAAAVPIPAQAN